MKRLLILLMLFASPVMAQTNTFCAANLTCNVTGTWSLNAVKAQNSIQFADQFSTGALVMITTAPGSGNISTGGTVAANTYACEITFQGTSGETTPTLTSPTTTTSGASSQLECQPLDVPTGSVSYNVYWQTGGAGSFFLGHSGVTLSTADLQSTTPATSGTTPPVSNTAVSILPTAQAALGGSGAVFVASSVATNAGQVGALSANQSMLDFRHGTTFYSRCQYPGNIQKNPGSAPAATCGSIDMQIPSQLGTAEQASGLSLNAHAENTPSYWGGLNQFNASISPVQVGVTRGGTRTEDVRGMEDSTSCNNALGACIGVETDINVTNGIYVLNDKGGTALVGLCAGGKCYSVVHAETIGLSATNNFWVPFVCDNNSFAGACLSIGTSAGAAFAIDSSGPGIHSNFAGSAFILDTPGSGQQTQIDFRDNGTSRWQIQKGTGNDLTFAPQAGAGKFFTPPIWLTAQACPTGFSGFAILCDDTTLAQLKASYTGTFFAIGQTGNSSGTHSDSGFYQSASVAGCTTAASIGGVCATPVTITWPVAFQDANYKMTCQGSGAITNFPIMGSVTARIAASATVQTMALTAAAASFATIECIAVHN